MISSVHSASLGRPGSMEEELDYFLPIPEAPGFLVSQDGEIIDQFGHRAGSLVCDPWGDLGVQLLVEGETQTRSPQEWAALAWRVETRRQRAMRLKMEALRQRVAAAEAIVMRRPGASQEPVPRTALALSALAGGQA